MHITLTPEEADALTRSRLFAEHFEYSPDRTIASTLQDMGVAAVCRLVGELPQRIQSLAVDVADARDRVPWPEPLELETASASAAAVAELRKAQHYRRVRLDQVTYFTFVSPSEFPWDQDGRVVHVVSDDGEARTSMYLTGDHLQVIGGPQGVIEDVRNGLAEMLVKHDSDAALSYVLAPPSTLAAKIVARQGR